MISASSGVQPDAAGIPEVEAARIHAEQESRDAAQRLASARAKDDDLRDALVR